MSTEKTNIRDPLMEYHALNVRSAKTTQWLKFQRVYRDDQVAFVHDIVDGASPTDYQDEILGSRAERLAIRGPRGLGKTAMASWKILHGSLCWEREDWKIPTTSSSWRQVEKYLWPEVHKWSRAIRWDLVGREPFDRRTELLQTSLRLRTGQAFGMASDDPALIEGAHADWMRFVYDEAKSIPIKTFDAVEGAFSNVGYKDVFAISTPGPPSGRFYDIHSRKPGYEDWAVRHVSLDECLRAGRLDPKWVEDRRRQWGEDSAVFKNHVLGEFANSDEDGVIPLSWIELAIERWDAISESEDGFDAFLCEGDDIARGGRDKTIRARRHAMAIKEIIVHDYADTMKTAGKIAAGLKDGGYAVVDVAGVGAGVVDRLSEQGFDIIGFNASHRTDQTDKTGELEFLNMRSLIWWHMRELLDPSNGFEVALPNNSSLIGDLTSPTWKVTSSGKIQIESKEDLRKRNGRSTDFADAVCSAFLDDTAGEIEFY